jgi:flavorubredoxin
MKYPIEMATIVAQDIQKRYDAKRAAEARAKRAQDGLEQIDSIASAIVGNPGCEKNTVQLVEDMAHLIQRLRGDLHEARDLYRSNQKAY